MKIDFVFPTVLLDTPFLLEKINPHNNQACLNYSKFELEFPRKYEDGKKNG